MEIRYPLNSSVTPADGSVTAAKLGDASVTGPKVGAGAIKTVRTTGRNGTGNITVGGLAAGDVILFAYNETDNSNVTTSFTGTIASNNTLAQAAATDLSAKTILLTLKSAS